MTAFLERPWVKKITESKYMVDLLRFLRVGRKYDAIRAKLSQVPEPYVLGALEALEKLGIVKTLNVQGDRIYVLSENGKILLAQIESLLSSSV